MTPKEYLSQAYYIDRRIRLDIEKAEKMRASLYGRGVSYQNDGSQHVPGGNSIENALTKALEYEERINAEIDELVNKRIEIEATINAVDDEVLQELLTRRYLQYQKWEVIAAEMSRDLRWIYRLHGRALKLVKITDH